jgi:hypothetical protein
MVTLIIPVKLGIVNVQKGFVLSIPKPNQLEIDIFSIALDVFNASISSTQPHISAI